MSNLIAFVGNPNVGKSVIFNKLTGQYAVVSNYAGTTVDVARANIIIAGQKYQIVDTPGTYSLMPVSEDEQITRDLIIKEKPNIIVQVCDMKNIERSLHLFCELSLFKVPMILVLNMKDEALQAGIKINIKKLKEILGIPIVCCTATTGDGVNDILKVIPQAQVSNLDVNYKNNKDILAIETALKDKSSISKALAVYLLSGDEDVKQYVPQKMHDTIFKLVSNIVKDEYKMVSVQIFHDNNKTILNIVSQVKTVNDRIHKNFMEKLGNICLHPIAGTIIMLFIIYVMYEFVGVFVAGTVVDWIQTKIFKGLLNPFMINCFDYIGAGQFIKDFFVGEYGIFTMAIQYAFAIIFPIIIAFFSFFCLLEDSGYLPRLSVILSRLFSLVGLNGKAVLPMVLGLGCGTMAVLSSRILETKKERLMVVILLSCAIPCSAQLGIILAMLSAVSLKATVVWLSSIIVSILFIGKILNFCIKGKTTNFIIEIPKMRIPSIINILSKIKMHIVWYMKEVVPLFIVATVGLFFMDKIHFLSILERWLSPIIVKFLGLPMETTSSFIMGFLRRDYGASEIYTLAQNGFLTGTQILVSAVVITLSVPCIAQSLMVVKEFGIKVASIIFITITTYAILFGGLLNFIFKFL